MKFHAARLFRRSVLLAAGFLLAAALPARAQFVLNFTDNDTANFAPADVFVTFQGGIVGSLGSESITYGTSVVNNATVTDTTSQSFSLQDIMNAGGFNITSATSTQVYVSYGSDSGFANQTAAPSPFTEPTTRYDNIELTTNGTTTGGGGGGGDITDIVQFGGSVKIDDYTGSPGSYTLAGTVQNTAPTNTILNALVNTTTLGLSSPAVITNNGTVVRVIGPDAYPASQAGMTVTNPFGNFTGYLTNLHTIGSNSTLSNNFGGDGAVGFNAMGPTYSTEGNATYDATYTFSGSVDSSGDIVMNGSVIFVGAANSTGNYTFSNLSITIPAANTTQSIYQEIISNGMYSGNWAGLDSFFLPGNTSGVASTAIQLKVAGDFEEGILTGFAGSTTYGNLSSAYWWANATNAFTYGPQPAQPSNSTYFGAYGSVIAGNSTSNISGNLTPFGAYGNPYDDRFGVTLLNADAMWNVTVLDDDAPVPEPSTDALIASSAALLVAAGYRRRKSLRARRQDSASSFSPPEPLTSPRCCSPEPEHSPPASRA